MKPIIGCDVHEMYTDYPLLLSRMDFIACRTGQGVYQPDAAYARHKKAIIGKRPLLAWHVQKPCGRDDNHAGKPL